MSVNSDFNEQALLNYLTIFTDAANYPIEDFLHCKSVSKACYKHVNKIHMPKWVAKTDKLWADAKTISSQTAPFIAWEMKTLEKQYPECNSFDLFRRLWWNLEQTLDPNGYMRAKTVILSADKIPALLQRFRYDVNFELRLEVEDQIVNHKMPEKCALYREMLKTSDGPLLPFKLPEEIRDEIRNELALEINETFGLEGYVSHFHSMATIYKREIKALFSWYPGCYQSSLDNRKKLYFYEIPEELTLLTHLRRLHMHGPFSVVPDRFHRLHNIRSLALCHSLLTTVPVAQLTRMNHLRELYLNNNEQLVVPPELGQMLQLKSLSLRENNLTTIPAELGNLTNLQLLDLYANSLTTVPPELGNLTQLRSLALSKNPTLTSLPSELARLTRLVKFYIDPSPLLREIPDEVQSLIDRCQSLKCKNPDVEHETDDESEASELEEGNPVFEMDGDFVPFAFDGLGDGEPAVFDLEALNIDPQ